MPPRRNRGLDSMAGIGYAEPSNILRHSYPNTQTPELDPKDERLLELSQKIGYLEGRNSVLEQDNIYIRDSLRSAEDDISSLRVQLEKAEKDRNQYRDDYYQYKREAENLRQYKPKEETKTNERDNLPHS
jgi:chromosome segregation ATPase